MVDEKTEIALINDIVNGNKLKYELLIRKYNQRLYRVAKSILWNEVEVEDAMQDAYIKAYQQLAKFESRSKFSTWITRILINECLMKKRKNKSVREEEIVDKSHPIENMNPEKEIVNRELKSLLESAIAKLPEKYRLVFVMREVENISASEVRNLLEITDSNVKVRLNRAKEMLRDSLITAYPANELLDFNLVRCDRIVQNVFAKI